MKTNYWPVGFAVVVASLVLPWFDPVTTPRFNALNFPFAHSAYLWPAHFVFFSYGTAALVVVGLGILAWWMGRGLAVFCAGALLLLGAMTFFLQIASWEPSWLRAALTGGRDFEQSYHFEVAYTIPNAVIVSPAKGLLDAVQGPGDRFSAASSTLGPGWSFYVAGAIWVCGAGLAQMRSWTRLRYVLPILALVFGAFAILQVWRPIAAERAITAAQVAEARGAFPEAEAYLQHAMQIDEWHRLQPDIRTQLGGLYERMGLHDRPETLLAQAAALQARGLVPEALFQYTRAADAANPQLRHVALAEKAKLAAHYAGTLYRQGVIGDAIHYWQISIDADPSLANGYFGAGKSSYDVADYPAAIKYFEPIFKKTSQINLRSDAESYLGDCYYKLGQLDKARQYYIASRESDDRANFRALKTLTDSYYK